MKKLRVGIQLYSLREEMAKDMDATLKAVSEMGYDCVEFAGFFDKPVAEVKAMCEKYNLTPISVHQGLAPYLEEESAKAMVAYLKELGVKYSVVPWMDVNVFKDKEQYAKFIADMVATSKLLKENGITLGYHNHDFEFEKVDGEYILDRLYNDMDGTQLQPELDLCWVKYGGEDPVKYVKKYAKRSHLVHFKDFVAKEMGGGPAYALIDENGKELPKKSKEENGFRFTPLGQGLQDFAPIVDAVLDSDIEYVIYEKDAWYDACPFEEAKQSREFLKEKFGI
ncbi:MAG: sugar phosphate isomerase/epimerase [Clostridia bacterium]|nr:sugar phosphate isomerase/epimerase [Clostridia bacterium]